MEINKIYNGDCLEVLKSFPDNSVDAIVTDPPYGLEFMGKEWDSFKSKGQGNGWQIAGKPSLEKFNGHNDWHSQSRPAFRGHTLEHWKNMENFFCDFGKEAIRVIKSGGFLLMFGGTRTYHRLACGIEEAGFEIRDMINWVYGSGFPKSLNIGKKIDQMAGAEREVIGKHIATYDGAKRNPNNHKTIQETCIESHKWGFKEKAHGLMDTAPASLQAKQWEGWGTSLKPAHEPIVVARKPISEKTVAENVLKFGTGGINIDGCRISYASQKDNDQMRRGIVYDGEDQPETEFNKNFGLKTYDSSLYHSEKARFPANLIHDGSDEVLAGFPDMDEEDLTDKSAQQTLFGDKIEKQIVNSSRFFYCAKAGKEERNYGCEELPLKRSGSMIGCVDDGDFKTGSGNKREGKNRNIHPTVKPLALMEYLIKLVTPPKGIVLDPFAGSGTTLVACAKLGFDFIGIEKEPDYIKIAEARVKAYTQQKKLVL